MASTHIFKKNLSSFFYVCLALLLLAGSYFRIFDLYEFQTFDWRCQLRGPRPVSDKIVLIDVWDDTLEQLGAWPIDREYHAELIRVLKHAQAKVLAFDILFVEPHSSDESVEKASKAAGNVYFVEAFLSPQNKKGHFTAEKILAPLIPGYASAARGVGHVNTLADADGKRRRVIPAIALDDGSVFQLSFKVAADLLGGGASYPKLIPNKFVELSQDKRAPLDDEGYFIVNYAGKWEETFTHYSYFDVLAAYQEEQIGQTPRLDLKRLKDKICFVGLTALGSHDTSPIPIQPIYPMVGAYANILNNILMDDYIRRAHRVWNMLILIFLGGWVAWISANLKPHVSLLRVMAIVTLFLLLCVFLFVKWGLWLDLFYPLLVMIVLYAATTLRRVIHEMRKRELIEGELQIASQIQQSFLPAASPENKGLDIAYYMKPAKAVGGDLFTFVPMERNRVGVLVGDVSGKGAPAALFMAKIVSEFKYAARDDADPSRVLSKLNDVIASEATGGLFVTATYAIFDVKEKKLLLSNGGHLPLVCATQKGSSELLSAEEGMPIGVMAEIPFANYERGLEVGDLFAFYSDGISEARNRKKEEFDVKRLETALVHNRHLKAAEILANISGEVHQFMGKAEQHDDMTLIIVKVSGAYVE